MREQYRVLWEEKGMNADGGYRINVNDPGLITLVNKLQDVFTTVGVCTTDEQEARAEWDIRASGRAGSHGYTAADCCCCFYTSGLAGLTFRRLTVCAAGTKPDRSASDRRGRITIKW